MEVEEADLSEISISHLQAWKEHAQERPLRLLVCGLQGTGKSTLVNRLLQLKDEKWAEEGRGGEATAYVTKYERTTERGIKVCIFGFGDVKISDEEVIHKMDKVTERKLDLVLYCISLSVPARLQQSDVDAFKNLTKVFSSEIWKKAVIVLTFANVLATKTTSAARYLTVIKCIKDDLKKVLRDNKVSKEIISQLPVVTAGHTNPILKYEGDKYLQAWDDRLFLEAIKQVDPTYVPAIFQFNWRWKEVGLVLAQKGQTSVARARVVTGAVVGGVSGSLSGGGTIGAVIGGIAELAIGGVGRAIPGALGLGRPIPAAVAGGVGRGIPGAVAGGVGRGIPGAVAGGVGRGIPGAVAGGAAGAFAGKIFLGSPVDRLLYNYNLLLRDTIKEQFKAFQEREKKTK